MKKDRERVTAEITLSHLMRQGNEQASCPCFYPACEASRFSSTALPVVVVEPRHGMTIGAEHCRAGHVQA